MRKGFELIDDIRELTEALVQMVSNIGGCELLFDFYNVFPYF